MICPVCLAHTEYIHSLAYYAHIVIICGHGCHVVNLITKRLELKLSLVIGPEFNDMPSIEYKPAITQKPAPALLPEPIPKPGQLPKPIADQCRWERGFSMVKQCLITAQESYITRRKKEKEDILNNTKTNIIPSLKNEYDTLAMLLRNGFIQYESLNWSKYFII